MKILALATHRYYAMVGLYEGPDPIWVEPQSYDMQELEALGDYAAAEDYRFNKLQEILRDKHAPLMGIDAFAATGGLLHPLDGGTYRVSPDMLRDLKNAEYGYNASNFGAALIQRLALVAGTTNVFVVDPPSVDELDEATRMTGVPSIRRRSGFHALNQKAVAHREAARLGKPVEECCFVVINIGATLSVGTHQNGRVIDCNDISSANGPMSLTQSGHLPPAQLAEMCFSGLSQDEVMDAILRSGGIKAHLDEDDMESVIDRVKAGDERAVFVMDAFIKQLAKQVGSGAALLKGRVDAIIVTGDQVRDDYIPDRLADHVSWIAPVRAYNGEDELQAVVEGACRVMTGAEDAKDYI